jgi:hypothetical protein
MYNNTGGTLGIYADGDTMVCVSIAAAETIYESVVETNTYLAYG